MESSYPRLDRSFYVLIATANPDDQTLIAQSLRRLMPTVQLSYASTPEQTYQCLLTTAAGYYDFPRLLVLDLQMADRQGVWQLLRQIRDHYPVLPTVLTSLDHRLETVRQAYNLGVRAFIHKSLNWNQWQEQLNESAYYWLKIVTLPKPPLF